MAELWTWLSSAPTPGDVLDLFGVIYVVLFGVGFVVSAYLASPDASRTTTDSELEPEVRRWAREGIAIFGAGLFFFVVRALQIDPLAFGTRAWMIASLVVLAVAAGRWFRGYQGERSPEPRQR